jgi:hypothetical protein
VNLDGIVSLEAIERYLRDQAGGVEGSAFG